MEGFAVPCPLAPDAPRLISSFCSSSRSFGLGFLQTPPRGNALALLLAFGSAKTWQSDLHRLSNVPCPAHTCRSAAPPCGRRLHAAVHRIENDPAGRVNPYGLCVSVPLLRAQV